MPWSSATLPAQISPPALARIAAAVHAQRQGRAEQSQGRLRGASKILGVCAVLILHFAIRYHISLHVPLEAHGGYLFCYSSSLSILAGHGCQQLPLAADVPAATPLREFIALQRPEITEEELAAYVEWLHHNAARASTMRRSSLDSTRTFELRVGALLWRLFGVRWSVIFTFYCMVSTLAALAVYASAAAIARSTWAGLLASLALTLSPFEALHCTSCIRDISPLWFAVFALGWLIAVVPVCRRWELHLAAVTVLGGLSFVGVGWRNDAQLLVPFLLVGVVASTVQQQRGWRHALMAALCFALGAGGVAAGINRSIDGPRHDPLMGFHMAYYADSVRANLFGLENCFQVAWSDGGTADAALTYRALNAPPEPERASARHGELCMQMWLKLAGYHAFDWWLHSPRFTWEALNNYPGRDFFMHPSTADNIQSVDVVQGSELWPPGFAFTCALVRYLPILLVVGLLSALRWVEGRLWVLLLAGFVLYYAAIQLLVLPMHKHYGMFLAPLAIVGGVGAWRLLLHARRPMTILSGWSSSFCRRAAWTAAIGLLAWCGIGVIALGVSAAAWSEALEDVWKRAEAGVDADELVAGGKVFAVWVDARSPGPEVGYLLDVATGPRPEPLRMQQTLCFAPDDTAGIVHPMLVLSNLHALQPKCRQQFFVTCLAPHWERARARFCKVTVSGETEIVGCTQVELTGWTGLAMSTVLSDGRRMAGSPAAPSPTTSTTNNSFHRLARPGQRLRVTFDSQTGHWQCSTPAGAAVWGAWAPGSRWEHLVAGDFDGDGLDDILGISPEGQLWVAVQQPLGIETALWGTLPHTAPGMRVMVDDFSGDRRADFAIIDPASSACWLAVSNGKSFTIRGLDEPPAKPGTEQGSPGDTVVELRCQVRRPIGPDPRRVR